MDVPALLVNLAWAGVLYRAGRRRSGHRLVLLGRDEGLPHGVPAAALVVFLLCTMLTSYSAATYVPGGNGGVRRGGGWSAARRRGRVAGAGR